MIGFPVALARFLLRGGIPLGLNCAFPAGLVCAPGCAAAIVSTAIRLSSHDCPNAIRQRQSCLGILKVWCNGGSLIGRLKTNPARLTVCRPIRREFYLRLGTERSTFRRLLANRTTETPPAKSALNAAPRAAQASRNRSRRRSQRSRCASTTSGRSSSSRSDRAWAMSTSGASRPRSAKRSNIAPD